MFRFMLSQFRTTASLLCLVILFITSTSFANNCADLLTSSFIKDVHQYIKIVKTGKKGRAGENVIVTESRFVQNEFAQITKNLESATLQMPYRSPSFPLATIEKQINDFLKDMKIKFANNEFTYADFMTLSQFHVDVFQAISIFKNNSDSSLLLAGFAPKPMDEIRTPNITKGLRFIPTTRRLSIYEMNAFSESKFGFLGLTTKVVRADHKFFGPNRFWQHDFTHTIISKFGSARVYHKIFKKFPARQYRIRSAIWFHFWHEFTWMQYKGRTLEHFKLFIEDLLNKKTEAYKNFMVEALSDESYGSDPKLVQDIEVYWDETLSSLLKL